MATQNAVATFLVVAFEGLDFEGWVKECGAEFVSMLPRTDGQHVLIIKGKRAAIDTFARDLGWSPEHIN